MPHDVLPPGFLTRMAAQGRRDGVALNPDDMYDKAVRVVRAGYRLNKGRQGVNLRTVKAQREEAIDRAFRGGLRKVMEKRLRSYLQNLTLLEPSSKQNREDKERWLALSRELDVGKEKVKKFRRRYNEQEDSVWSAEDGTHDCAHCDHLTPGGQGNVRRHFKRVHTER